MTTLELLHGDCLQVMKDIPDSTIDCFICDLPYGCLTGGGGKEKKKRSDAGQEGVIAGCPWDVKLNLVDFWAQIKRLRRNKNTPVLMFATTKFGYELIQSNPTWFRYDIIWDKQRGVSFLTANKMPMRSHEMIYVFSERGAYYNRIDVDGRCALSVIQIPTATARRGHPTEKPVELYSFLLQRYCPPGGTVLDPTAGSFNSCFAAFDLNLNSIGIEKDDAFYKKACERADRLENKS